MGTRSDQSTVVTMPCPGTKALLQKAYTPGFLPVLSFTLYCERTWDPSIMTRFCAFNPWCPQWAVLGTAFTFCCLDVSTAMIAPGLWLQCSCGCSPAVVVFAGVAAAKQWVTVFEDLSLHGPVLGASWRPAGSTNQVPRKRCPHRPFGMAGPLGRLTVEIKQTCMNKLSFSFVCT